MLAKWNEKLVAVIISWNNFVRIAKHSESRLWSMAISTIKSKFHPCRVFSIRTLLRDGRHAKREFRALG